MHKTARFRIGGRDGKLHWTGRLGQLIADLKSQINLRFERGKKAGKMRRLLILSLFIRVGADSIANCPLICFVKSRASAGGKLFFC